MVDRVRSCRAVRTGVECRLGRERRAESSGPWGVGGRDDTGWGWGLDVVDCL